MSMVGMHNNTVSRSLNRIGTIFAPQFPNNSTLEQSQLFQKGRPIRTVPSAHSRTYRLKLNLDCMIALKNPGFLERVIGVE
jgi:hypothetical protein